MALAETTLSVAVGETDKAIVLASATSIVAGRLILVDQEVMQVAKDYSTGTTVPVLRGLDGTRQVSHVISARVTHGDAADFQPSPGQATTVPLKGRTRLVVSQTASGSITLPPPGADLLVILTGTSVIAVTVPVPTKELDGTQLVISANGAAAHTITFTGGLAGASTSYDVLTMNGTGPCTVVAYACNEVWHVPVAVGMAGTLTNITATLA